MKVPVSHGRAIYSAAQPTALKRTFLADFRSDTVTTPTPEMRSFMMDAIVGDDVFQEDLTVNELEKRVAAISGKEAGLFCPSGTMSNQLAIRAHLKQPPYSVICDKRAHVNTYEGGGISFHCGAAVITTLPKPGFDYLTADVIEKELILDDDVHHAPTKLICLENTMNGTVFPLSEQIKISALAKQSNVAIHLDGARLWNAITKTGDTLQKACDPYDTVSLCFSKGLGAPIGSVLVGPASLIKKARHFRKIYGGGMRQSGILAAACIYALDNHFPKLIEDHKKAAYLAQELVNIGFKLTKPCETSMVWIDGAHLGLDADKISKALAEKDILIFGGSSTEIRLVVHHQISQQALDLTILTLKTLIVS